MIEILYLVLFFGILICLADYDGSMKRQMVQSFTGHNQGYHREPESPYEDRRTPLLPETSEKETNTKCLICNANLFIHYPPMIITTVPAQIRTFCKKCDSNFVLRYGECLECGNKPIWNFQGEARQRCIHGLAIYDN